MSMRREMAKTLSVISGFSRNTWNREVGTVVDEPKERGWKFISINSRELIILGELTEHTSTLLRQ